MKIALPITSPAMRGSEAISCRAERAYHGVNIGGTALGGMVRNREAFGA